MGRNFGPPKCDQHFLQTYVFLHDIQHSMMFDMFACFSCGPVWACQPVSYVTHVSLWCLCTSTYMSLHVHSFSYLIKSNTFLYLSTRFEDFSCPHPPLNPWKDFLGNGITKDKNLLSIYFVLKSTRCTVRPGGADHFLPCAMLLDNIWLIWNVVLTWALLVDNCLPISHFVSVLFVPFLSSM